MNQEPPYYNLQRRHRPRWIGILLAFLLGIPMIIGLWLLLWRWNYVSYLTGPIGAGIICLVYGFITQEEKPPLLDVILLIAASVLGTVIGFAVCLAESLHIYTKIGFLAMVEFIISPPTWTILWKANPMAILSLLFSIGLSIYIILWVWRISKRAVL